MTLMPPLGILYRISDLLAPIVYHVEDTAVGSCAKT